VNAQRAVSGREHPRSRRSSQAVQGLRASRYLSSTNGSAWPKFDTGTAYRAAFASVVARAAARVGNQVLIIPIPSPAVELTPCEAAKELPHLTRQGSGLLQGREVAASGASRSSVGC
jgi:hypothetical protein